MFNVPLGLSLLIKLTKITPGWRGSNWNSVDKLHFCRLMRTLSSPLLSSPLHAIICMIKPAE